ncbi:MAG: hypothetical protein P8J17_02515 [Halioglobus sp.]|jgi:Spy/CpxP family protein refolding chaperone|nr:hypothetical protein [Halioglobus sp.]
MKKSMTKAVISTVAAGVALLSFAVGSWSMPLGAGYENDPARMTSFMSKKLDFTESQEASAKVILTTSFEEVEADVQRLKILKKQLRVQEDGFDAAVARESADEIGEITARLVFLKANTFAEISGLLNEEQRSKVARLIEKREERGGMRRALRKSRLE